MTAPLAPFVRADLGDLAPALDARLEGLIGSAVVPRLWQGDHTLWDPDPAEISSRLDWLTLPEAMAERLPSLAYFARRCEEFDRFVLLGMGGSSLAPEVIARAPGARPLTVLDSTHPAAVLQVERSGDLSRTLFLVASKSGSTVETLAQYAYFRERTGTSRQFVAVTDPGSPLERLAQEHGFAAWFINPEGVGGRYAALSLFGLVPAAAMGLDPDLLLSSGRAMAAACRSERGDNPGLWLGALLGEAALRGRDKLTLLGGPPVTGLGDWIEQLLAESTGKRGRGILPVVGEMPGPPGVYNRDRVFVATAGDAAAPAPAAVLPAAGFSTLGGEFFRWEFATAVAGHILGINPFDQPDVEAAKEAARAVLSASAKDPVALGDLRTTLASLRDGDYLALLAYLPRTDEHAARLQRVRTALRDRYRLATTLGFGPRYLHSTGQLHKGGPNTGVFVQVIDGPSEDAAIPGQAFSFRRLLDAQADGDLAALRSRGRRCVRVPLDQLEQEV